MNSMEKIFRGHNQKVLKGKASNDIKMCYCRKCDN